ncbi:MAG: DUF4332 domain-containing protein [Salinibacter sp.]
MAWIKAVTQSVASGVRGLANGVWATVATPLVYSPLRPVTKQAIKGGFWIARGAQSLVELTQERWNDIVAEAEAETHSASPPRLETPSTAADSTRTNGAPAGPSSSPEAGEETSSDNLTDVKGIGDRYARLLRAADINSVEQLAACEPEPLRTRLQAANDADEIVRRVPSADRIRGWIEEAAGQRE